MRSSRLCGKFSVKSGSMKLGPEGISLRMPFSIACALSNVANGDAGDSESNGQV